LLANHSTIFLFHSDQFPEIKLNTISKTEGLEAIEAVRSGKEENKHLFVGKSAGNHEPQKERRTHHETKDDYLAAFS
jgi:hypothetical protein